jgi:hypothetical protein
MASPSSHPKAQGGLPAPLRPPDRYQHSLSRHWPPADLKDRRLKSGLQLREKIGLARSFQIMSPEEREKIVQRVADLAGNKVEYYKA